MDLYEQYRNALPIIEEICKMMNESSLEKSLQKLDKIIKENDKLRLKIQELEKEKTIKNGN